MPLVETFPDSPLNVPDVGELCPNALGNRTAGVLYAQPIVIAEGLRCGFDLIPPWRYDSDRRLDRAFRSAIDVERENGALAVPRRPFKAPFQDRPCAEPGEDTFDGHRPDYGLVLLPG